MWEISLLLAFVILKGILIGSRCHDHESRYESVKWNQPWLFHILLEGASFFILLEIRVKQTNVIILLLLITFWYDIT